MRIAILLGLAALLALTGCPKAAHTAKVVPQGLEDQEASTANGTLGTNATATAPEGSTAPADQPAGSPAPVANAPAASAPKLPTPAQLEGKWFALYGKAGQHSGPYDYQHSHQLEFLPDGSAIWDTYDNGDKLQSSWTLNGGKVSFNVGGSGVGKFGKDTPLAFGRDSEIGLTKTGRDSEVGLGAKASGASGEEVFTFTPQLDGDLLALVGDSGELMVYGREKSAGAVPQVAGNWVVHLTGQQNDAKLTLQGDLLTATWEPYQSTFTGHWDHGYFVGRVASSGGSAYAAFAPEPDGSLNGAVSPEPYEKMDPQFDFTRGRPSS